MENLGIYNKLKEVPENALREIKAGRLKGKSDISPQWRIEKMTEVFGAIGFGWNYKVTRSELIFNEQTKETACFVDIELTVMQGDKLSQPIFGTGGSMFVTQETSKLYCSDECFKMALTDALSVAMKQLGMGADVYRGFVDTKYAKEEQTQHNAPQTTPQPEKWLNMTFKDGTMTPEWKNLIKGIEDGKIHTIEDVTAFYKINKETRAEIQNLLNNI